MKRAYINVEIYPDSIYAAVSVGGNPVRYIGEEEIRKAIEALDGPETVWIGCGLRRTVWTLRAICEGLNWTEIAAMETPWDAVKSSRMPVFFDISDGRSITELRAYHGDYFFSTPPADDGEAVPGTARALHCEDGLETIIERFGDPEIAAAYETRMWLADKYGDYSLVGLSLSGLAARVLRAKAPDELPEEHRDIPAVPETICGLAVTGGNGGLHGAKTGYHGTDITVVDVNSMYPSIMVRYGLCPRGADAGIYAGLLKVRLKAKASGDSMRADAAKLILNATYGAMRCEWSPLYDPDRADAICKLGQSLIADLARQLPGVLVQINTDGVMVAGADVGDVKAAVEAWQMETGLTCTTERWSEMWQRDVNTYLLRATSGEIKARGALRIGGDWDHDGDIIKLAVQDWLLYQIEIADTVNGHGGEREYQLVRKVTSDCPAMQVLGKSILPDDVIRVYAVRDGVRVIRRREDGTTCSMGDTPTSLRIDNAGEMQHKDIDLSWYVKAAEKLLQSVVSGKTESKAGAPERATTSKRRDEIVLPW